MDQVSPLLAGGMTCLLLSCRLQEAANLNTQLPFCTLWPAVPLPFPETPVQASRGTGATKLLAVTQRRGVHVSYCFRRAFARTEVLSKRRLKHYHPQSEREPIAPARSGRPPPLRGHNQHHEDTVVTGRRQQSSMRRGRKTFQRAAVLVLRQQGQAEASALQGWEQGTFAFAET